MQQRRHSSVGQERYCLKCKDSLNGQCALEIYKVYADEYTNQNDSDIEEALDIEDIMEDEMYEQILVAKQMFKSKHDPQDIPPLQCPFETASSKCFALMRLKDMLIDRGRGIHYLDETEQAHATFYHRTEIADFWRYSEIWKRDRCRMIRRTNDTSKPINRSLKNLDPIIEIKHDDDQEMEQDKVSKNDAFEEKEEGTTATMMNSEIRDLSFNDDRGDSGAVIPSKSNKENMDKLEETNHSVIGKVEMEIEQLKQYKYDKESLHRYRFNNISSNHLPYTKEPLSPTVVNKDKNKYEGKRVSVNDNKDTVTSILQSALSNDPNSLVQENGAEDIKYSGKYPDDFGDRSFVDEYQAYADRTYQNKQVDPTEATYALDIDDSFKDDGDSFAINLRTKYLKQYYANDKVHRQCKFQNASDDKQCHAYIRLLSMHKMWELTESEHAHVILYHRDDYKCWLKDQKKGRVNRFGRSITISVACSPSPPPDDDDGDEAKYESRMTLGVTHLDHLGVHGDTSSHNLFSAVSVAIGEEKSDDTEFALSMKGNNGKGVSFAQNTYPSAHDLFSQQSLSFSQFQMDYLHDQMVSAPITPLMGINYSKAVQDHKLNLEKERNVPKHTDVVSFGFEFVAEKEEAKWKNLKQEVLRCEMLTAIGKSATITEWNNLIRRCPFFAKLPDAREMVLDIYDVVALKLYTDFDDLQRQYRKCIRITHQRERINNQCSFVHWNAQMNAACKKATASIDKPLFHGLGAAFRASVFNGKYWGPVSTTTKFEVAAGFGGDNGAVFQLEPLHNARGMWVRFLSSHYLEDEILYMNCCFAVVDILDPKTKQSKLVPSSMLDLYSQQLARTLPEETRAVKLKDFTENVKKSWLGLGVNPAVLSLNKEIGSSESIFGLLEDGSKIGILLLLYLQYDESRLNQYSENEIAILNEVREQFIRVVEGVKAVQMDDTSPMIQHFLSADQHEYRFWQIYSNLDDLQYEVSACCFKMQTIIRLFPSAEEICINAKNWDFTLNSFRQFLDKWRLDFTDVAIKYIDITFDDDDTGKSNDERAIQLMTENGAKPNISYLSKMGWRFLTPCKLSNVGFQPKPELPFLMTFMDKKENDVLMYRRYTHNVLDLTPEVPEQEYLEGSSNEKPRFARGPGRTLTPRLFQEEMKTASIPGSTPTAKCLTPSQSGLIPSDTEAKEEHFDYESEGKESKQRIEIQHNPKICFLSKNVWKALKYKDSLLKMLEVQKQVSPKGPGFFGGISNNDSFLKACNSVMILTLDPMPRELKPIFLDENKNVDYHSIAHIFPSVTDIFLRGTDFTMAECRRLCAFLVAQRKRHLLTFQRIFYKEKAGGGRKSGVPSTKTTKKDKDDENQKHAERVKRRQKALGALCWCFQEQVQIAFCNNIYEQQEELKWVPPKIHD